MPICDVTSAQGKADSPTANHSHNWCHPFNKTYSDCKIVMSKVNSSSTQVGSVVVGIAPLLCPPVPRGTPQAQATCHLPFMDS